MLILKEKKKIKNIQASLRIMDNFQMDKPVGFTITWWGLLRDAVITF